MYDDGTTENCFRFLYAGRTRTKSNEIFTIRDIRFIASLMCTRHTDTTQHTHTHTILYASKILGIF